MTVPRVLAHRGATAVAPENTVEAFVAAGALGADGVELDVHRTADGGLVVHHDADARGVGVLAERTEAEIRAARPEIPTLDEAFEACAGLLVNVEVKNLPGDADYDPAESVAAGVVELLDRRGRQDDVLVSSFNLESVDRVREIDASIPTGFLMLVGMDPVDAVDVAYAHGHGAVHPDVRALVGDAATATITRAHEVGMTVNVWTVNDEDELRRLAAAGVDSVITDVPDVARRVLAG
ncbi:MAG TPA: glycerophosphodiester phosphodiesterase [Acidimicrobiia bacterium]|nr:glycerophosphodiester phosphodiesterase [Acidimicrobiia bacterium]